MFRHAEPSGAWPNFSRNELEEVNFGAGNSGELTRQSATSYWTLFESEYLSCAEFAAMNPGMTSIATKATATQISDMRRFLTPKVRSKTRSWGVAGWPNKEGEK
jgi:hypothetical protein